MHHRLSQPEWIAIAAHRLHWRWRSLNPVQLEELAAELWQDERLATLEPASAVEAWLSPVLRPPLSRE